MSKNLFGAIVMGLFIISITGYSQDAPAPLTVEQSLIPITLASGPSVNQSEQSEAVFSESVRVPGASWLRLQFDTVDLGQAAPGRPETFVRITSMLDGGTQILTAETMRQWGRTSAYFNGDAVLVEIIADGTADTSYIAASQAWAGAPVSERQLDETICGPVDDRALSNDPRIGRGLNAGICTAWIVNDEKKCLISAGHCNPYEIIQFNVPLSTSGGSLVHPGPEDQYVVDPASVQFADGGLGNDWAYFAVFPNSNTGLTPYEAQGNVAFNLADPPAPVAGDIRITGMGSVNAPVDLSWYGVQKTHVGDFTDHIGDVLYYTADTTGGNSGGPVILEGDDTAIGIHTNGGCFNGGGANAACSINAPGLVNALNNPKGLCRPDPRLLFQFPDGLPDLLNPLFGKIRVNILDQGNYIYKPGSGMLHYSTDGGQNFSTLALKDLGNNEFLAEFPHLPCPNEIRYYFTAETMDDIAVVNKIDAPTDSYALYTGTESGWSERHDFETDTGWTVNATVDTPRGIWERGTPRGGGVRLDPPFDGDGSGQCFITDNYPIDSDVDGSNGNGGLTWVISPAVSIPPLAMGNGYMSFRRWFGWSDSSSDETLDNLTVYIRKDGAQNATMVDQVLTDHPDANAGWKKVVVDLTGIVAANEVFRAEFYVADEADPSIVEAGVDDVRFMEFSTWSNCTPCRPDFVNDDIVDIADLREAGSQWGGGAAFDLTNDLKTNILDLVVIAKAFGQCPN